MVRQAMPSAWPTRSRCAFWSMILIFSSGKADSWAASVKPVGPQATIRTSSSSGGESEGGRLPGRCYLWIAGPEPIQ